MKPTLFQIGKQAIFSENVQDSPHGFHVSLAWIFDIDEDVIQINDNENIEFFCQNLLNVALKACWNIR